MKAIPGKTWLSKPDEVQINNRRTPPEEQLLFEEAAIHACVGMLID